MRSAEKCLGNGAPALATNSACRKLNGTALLSYHRRRESPAVRQRQSPAIHVGRLRANALSTTQPSFSFLLSLLYELPWRSLDDFLELGDAFDEIGSRGAVPRVVDPAVAHQLGTSESVSQSERVCVGQQREGESGATESGPAAREGESEPERESGPASV